MGSRMQCFSLDFLKLDFAIFFKNGNKFVTYAPLDHQDECSVTFVKKILADIYK